MPRASIQTARPALRRLPTRPSRVVQAVLQQLLPLVFLGQRLQLRNSTAAQRLAAEFLAQQNGERNLLIAFRHPSPRDPLVLADLFWSCVPRMAGRLGHPLPRRVSLRFLYDRGIPLWAGPVIGWLLQRSGGIAIHRGRLDRPALNQAREALAQGRQALVVAPEGATNNLSGEMAPLEPGVAQLAFWAAEDMARNQDPRSLHVIPVGIRYSWRRPNWTVLDARLQALEQHLGVQAVVPEDRRERLLRIGAALITALEQLERLKANPEQPLADRIENYRLHGLQKAESHFGLRASGTLQERCRRIEQAAWDRIYRENLEQLPPLERSLVDWEAREADLQLTRMRLVEHFTSVSGHYITDQPEFDRFAEMVQLVEEAIGWIEDRPWSGSPCFGPQRVELSVGEAIPVDQRRDDYRRDRRRAVQTLTLELDAELERLMRSTGNDSRDRGATLSA
ncbi:MAG: lysophospholipid acyltransferase family protein [Cyanobacteriota bacterium]|nr:lysophospholipid acyltransferase family protein [Cyanobacteriota bacterium]